MWLLFLCAALSGWTASAPITAPPPSREDVSLESSTPPGTAAEWYEQALLEIRKGHWKESRSSLQRALLIDSNFVPAQLQLAFLDLWEGKEEAAYHLFFKVLQEEPCQSQALEGLHEIGNRWGQIEVRQEKLVPLYRTLDRCQPNNPDTLYYLGRSLTRTGNYEEGEKVLLRCLALAPNYGDAEIQLGYLYLWQGKLEEARERFEKYPQSTDAKFGLARVAKQQRDTETAHRHLKEVIAQDPKHRPARQERARLLVEDLNYSEAETEFAWLIDDDPNPSNYWAEMFDIKGHTRFGIALETFYTMAKENDPDLRAPVVRDYYFYNGVHILIPLFDQWKLDLKQIYYHQRENDIYPPFGVNYSAFLAGGQVSSSYFFAKDWKWDVSARAFQAWGTQAARFPFRGTNRLELGTGLLYNSERQLFSVDIHTESFIIKNFSKNNSSLLRTDYLTGGYAYRFTRWPCKPELEAWISHVFIHDSPKNWENTEIAILRCGIPWIDRSFTALYEFEHGHFNQLSQNYYSFKQQLRNTLGVLMKIRFAEGIVWETTYKHRWETTYNLLQPIGNNLFVAAKRYLLANSINSDLVARFRDQCLLTVGGHYFRDTLPYRDWNVHGSFTWLF